MDPKKKKPVLRRPNRSTFCAPPPRPIFPSDFADKLISKEMKLDSVCSMEVINELVELYGMAVEHYENIGDTRHIDYQERM
jgi:hypothetical protein